MRPTVKGGIWTNTEDEILKVAVMKYGKNQWARISSLLTRKSPKQCKARWYEWIDPSIKKTEWSKDEDEKLLHLAKLMPTQWRTIAPIVGRTPAQCLERYQRLLDEAEMKDVGEGTTAGPSADDVRRLRPGEIDPDPETKPARPDPVDMDEDEKEMLSEARARLANTQGKKAKRRARERQLEEARRLATLQKRRELRAAGIESYHKRKYGQMNYNHEIPFHTPAPMGFFDTAEEKKLSVDKTFRNTALKDLEKASRAEREEELEKNDAKRKKLSHEKGDVPDLSLQLAKLKEAQEISKRKKLNLPAPQIGEDELDEIVKLSSAGESARAIVNESGNIASQNLLGNAGLLQNEHSSFRTPLPTRTPMARNTIQTEAANLLALQNAQTPLLGGANNQIIDGGTGFDGITPQHHIVQTPNPLLASLTPKVVSGGESTHPTMLSQTPLRDEFKINENIQNEAVPIPTSTEQHLSFGFGNLPKPKNDFEIVIPEVDEANLDGTVAEDGVGDIAVVDRDDLERMDRKRADEEKRKKIANRPSAIRRRLPVPSNPVDKKVFYEIKSGNVTADFVQQLVVEEMYDLLNYNTSSPENLHEMFDIKLLKQADEMVDHELPTIYEELGRTREELVHQTYEEISREINSRIIVHDGSRLKSISSRESANDNQKLAHVRALTKTHHMWLNEIRKKNEALIKQLGDQGEYVKASSKDLKTKYEKLRSSQEQANTFDLLRTMEESVSIRARIEKLAREVRQVKDKEKLLQAKFRELQAKN